MKKTTSLRAFGVLFAMLSGCAALPEDSDPTQVEEINNGTVVPDGFLGMVRVFQNGTEQTGSGVLLRNDWVLTTSGPVSESTSVTVRWADQTATVDRQVYYWAPFPGQSPTTAWTPNWAVLMHLSTPITLNGSTQGFTRRISTAPSMAGRSLYCLGTRNNNTLTGPLRAGSFTPVRVDNDLRFYLSTNAQGQSVDGDSGSACFDGSDLAGVYASVQNPSYGYQFVSGPTFARTIEEVMNTTAPPSNDTRAGAIEINAMMPPLWESTMMGTTSGATHDGPTVPCACTVGPDIWYRFHVERDAVAVYYFDTAGSSFDTSLVITDSAGVPLAGNALSPGAGLCNDDALCTTGGFTSVRQSRTAGVFREGTYYLVVGGCSTGRVVLHTQRADINPGPGSHQILGVVPLATSVIEAPLAGTGTVAGVTPGGPGLSTSSCGGDGAETLHWFTSCGNVPLQFSLCQSAGGSYTRRYTNSFTGAYADFDPVLRLRSEPQLQTLACNDDGGTLGATNCVGTGGDSSQYGSHIASTGVRRGIGFIYVDERTAHSAPALYPLGSSRGMGYTLAYSVR